MSQITIPISVSSTDLAAAMTAALAPASSPPSSGGATSSGSASSLAPAAQGASDTAPSDVPAPPATSSSSPSGPPYSLPNNPRFWGTAAEISELLAKAATTEGKTILANARACALGAADKSGDRLLCGSFLYRFGAALGCDNATIAALGAQAVADLLAAPAGRQGIEADVGWGGAPWAFAFDALQSLLTSAQLGTLQAAAAATLALPMTDTIQAGYNQLSGDVAMALALATAGAPGGTPGAPIPPSGGDWVSAAYFQNWFRGKAPFWNYANQEVNWADGGSREGFAQYFCSCYTNFATRALFETATGDRQSLELGYFRNAPYWALFQFAPDTIGGRFPIALYTSTFSGGGASSRGLWSILKACTRLSDDKGKQLARWLVDQAGGWSAVARTPGDDLLFGLLIGDPRVKGVDPGTLGVPLTLAMPRPGEVFARSDWTPTANVFWFGNHVQASRVTPAGEFLLYSKGNYLIGSAAQRIAHSYACRWFQPGVCFVGADGTPACSTVNSGSVPDYTPRATFGGLGAANEAAPNFTPPATGKISHCMLTPSCDPAVQNITLAVDVLCDPSLTPHLVLPCVAQPVLNMDGTVTIANGAASCTLSFDTKPAELFAVGGAGHFADGLPGTAFSSSPFLLAGTLVDPSFAALVADAYASPATKTSVASLVAMIQQMGLWRLHVVLPAGGGKLTTKIQVH